MKTLKRLFFLTLHSLSSTLFAQQNEPLFATISAKNVLLYEMPSTISPVVRRVFNGEILKIIETIKTTDGSVWGKVYLSPKQVGYIQELYFNHTAELKEEVWIPNEVFRSQMPISFSLKGPAEIFGAGLQFRYLPFARLGMTVGVGSVLDEGDMKGSSLAFGVICMLSMDNFTPFVESGNSTLTFNDTHSTLRISSFYVNAGVEWMFQSGYYLGLGISYIRSYDVQVSFDYSYAKSSSGSLSVGNYGSFNNVEGAASLQRLNPLLILGYSF